MGRAAVVSVGDELLAGRTQDTNATWVSAQLRNVGFPVVHRETVPDDASSIAEAVTRCAGGADVVVVSGGLGPTPDDLTRHGIAEALGVRCHRDEDAESWLRAAFERVGRPLHAASLTQAEMPEGADPLQNRWGSAPGIRAMLNDALVFVLPGVPRELRGMTELHVLPALRGHPAQSSVKTRRSVTLCGVPESRVGSMIEDLMQRGRDPAVGSYPGVAHIVLVIEGTSQEAVAADVEEIRRRMGDAFVGEGELALNEVVAERLIETGTTIAVAESLTGGRIADLLVSVPGISSVFKAGFSTYANQAKRDLLGVHPATLSDHGAVSEQCAREMAEGARRVAETDVAVATTGIAGPTGAVPGKPVGTVYIALATVAGTEIRRLELTGDRLQVRERASTAALDWLRRTLPTP